MLTIKKGDTGIGIEAQLSDDVGFVDLTGCKIEFVTDDYRIRPKIINAKEGIVLIVFEKVHTQKVGFYEADFMVHFPDGRRETFPENGYAEFKIYDSKEGGSL